MTDTPLIRAAKATLTEETLDAMAKAAWESEAEREAWLRDLMTGGAYSQMGADGKLRRIGPLDFRDRGE